MDFLLHELSDLAFPVWRFLNVLSHPPQDLKSFYVALIDNCFVLILIGRMVHRVYYRFAQSYEEDSHASNP